MSLYSLQKHKGVQPWAETFAFGGRIRDFYESRGDAVVSIPTEIATVLDGPEKVVRYGNLTVSSTLTASQRCKGLTIICDSLTVASGGKIGMTGKGARVMSADDPFFPFADYRIPDQITLSSSYMTRSQVLSAISQQGLAPWDQGTWQSQVNKLHGFALAVLQQGQTVLMQTAGCGSGGVPVGMGTGAIGTAGANGGMGGGGSGGSNSIGGGGYYAARGGYGCPYSGGSGSGAAFANSGYDGYTMEGAPLQSKYSGPGGRGGLLWHSHGYWVDQQLAGYGCGGAGNPGGLASGGTPSAPGGNGTGGKLTIICFGGMNVQAGGVIEANGVAGGSAANNSCGGGGSGGGAVFIISQSLATSGTIQAAGGAGGTGNYATGGAGGAGSVVTKTFAQMGWI